MSTSGKGDFMFPNKKSYSNLYFVFLMMTAIVTIGHISKVSAQIIWLDQRYWIVRDRGPEGMEADLSPKVQVALPGHYRLKGNILYNSGNQQLNESFYMLVRDENGVIHYPLDPNTSPASYKVVPDDSVDGKHRVWRDAGLFYFPSADMQYTIEFHHYATIWDEYPYFINQQHYEGERNAESLNVDAIELVYEPFVNGAVSLQAKGVRRFDIGGEMSDGVYPGESFIYQITVKNLQEYDIMKDARLVSLLPDSIKVADFSLMPGQVDGRKIIWDLPNISPLDSLQITFTATVEGAFAPGYTPLVKTAQLVQANDSDPTDNLATSKVYVFNSEGWPQTPTADVGVSVIAKTDSFQLSGNDTLKYVKPGEIFDLLLVLENNDIEEALNLFLYNQPPPYLTIQNYSMEPYGQSFGFMQWRFASLLPGGRVVIRMTAKVDTALKTNNLPLTDLAMLFTENDVDLDNNISKETVLLAWHGGGTDPFNIEMNKLDLSFSYQAETDKTARIDGKVEQVTKAGEQVRYTLIIRNNGPEDARNIRTWVNVPDSAQFSNFNESPKYLAFEKHFWFIDFIAANEEREITFEGTAGDSLPFIPFALPSKGGVYVENDSLMENNIDSTLVYVVADSLPELVDLSVQQYAHTDSMVIIEGDSVNFVENGDSYRITISLRNNSAVEATNVRLVDLFPDSATASDFSLDPTFADDDSAVWLFDSLPPREERVIDFTATVADSMPIGVNWLINNVYASADNENPDSLFNNVSSDSVLNRVEPTTLDMVDLSVSQRAIADSSIVSDEGEVVPFVAKDEIFQIIITVKNKSNAVAKDVTLVENIAELGLVLTTEPQAQEAVPDSLVWSIPRIDALGEMTFQLEVQLSPKAPIGRHTLDYRATVGAANEDTTANGDNVALLTVIGEIVPDPVTATIRSTPPVVDVGDSIHVDIRVDGEIASYDIWVLLPDGSVDSTFADNFIAQHSLTPSQWLGVSPGFAISRLLTDAREEPITFELRAIDLLGGLVAARTTSMVVSSNYLVLDRNVFKPEQEDHLGIRFKLSYRRRAKLDIYDLNGRHINQIVEDIFDGGWTTYYWDGRTVDGQKVGSGVYLVTLRSGEFNSYKKFILVR